MRGACAALVALALGGIGAARGQGCDVLDNSVNVLEVNDFGAQDLHIRIPASVGTTVQLVDGSEPGGSSSQIWFAQQERVTDGFIATFDFVFNGLGDGFAFVVQNDKTSNTLGGARENLGFRDAIDKFIAVGFETCTNGAEPCQEKVVIWTQGVLADGDTPVPVAEAPLAATTIATASLVTAQVVYSQKDQEVTVLINGDVIVAGPVGDVETEIFGSKQGWFGFAASTFEDLTADVEIFNFRLDQQPSSTAITTPLAQTVDFGDSVVFTLVNRNNCQQPVAFAPGAVVVANLTNDNQVALGGIVNEEDKVEGRDFFLPTLSTNVAGAIEMRFDLPFRVETSWTLQVEVDGVGTNGTPLGSAVISKEPEPDTGLPTYGLALLITIIALIVIGLIYAVVRLRRYRKKLRENALDIDAGKEKYKLDQLDNDMSYNINPMLGSLDEMKKKLADNEKELSRLRSGKSNLYDDDYTIEKLQEQNSKLRDEMNKLKKEVQQDEALNTNYSGQVEGSKNVKKQFEQSRA